jgi:3-deoxy-manno-octulosonate cytidylyltransferase (CMP-KDO synthetase)
MRVVCIIPARMGSSRFPGKPLAAILGKPMIEHVYRRCRLNASLADVYVATCDSEIASATEQFGGKAILTSPSHERASDRVAEAAERSDADVILMVQGDEPLIRPEMIDLSLQPFRNGDDSVLCTNLAAPIRTEEEFRDPNTIKVAIALNGDALYFSRQPIPSNALVSFDRLSVLKQVCIIPFRRDFLRTYQALEPTPLEIAESIDMLRALEHGYRVRMVRTEYATHAVDTLADLALVEKLLQADPLTETYSR